MEHNWPALRRRAIRAGRSAKERERGRAETRNRLLTGLTGFTGCGPRDIVILLVLIILSAVGPAEFRRWRVGAFERHALYG